MKITQLPIYPKHVETVSKWIFDEFVKNSENNMTFEQVFQRFRSRVVDLLPMTFVALENDQCLGTVSLFSNDLKTRMDLTPWLAALYVDKEHRGKGIGEQLLDKMIMKAKDLGYENLYLRTEHTSEYYKKRNWEHVCNTIDEYGQETDVFVYRLKGK